MLSLPEVDLAYPRIVRDLLRRALDEDGAVDENGDPLGEPEDEPHVVLDEKNGDVSGQPGEHAEDFRAFVSGNPGLVPSLPFSLRAIHATPVTVTSIRGNEQLRLLAVPEPGSRTLMITTSLSKVSKTVGQLELILVIGSAAAGLLAVGGVAWIMRRGLRPIEAMAGQADKISAGDLTERVSPADTRTEAADLGPG